MNYTWENLHEDVNVLAEKVNGIDYSCIIGLSRGGLIPGVMLSHQLGIPFESLGWSFRDSNVQNEFILNHIMNWTPTDKKILIVDDICDSGKTLLTLTAFLQKRFFCRPGFDTAVLINNIVAEDFQPTFYVRSIDRTTDNRWVNFCWEKA